MVREIDIRHKKTKLAVIKYGLTPEILETFNTLDDLKKFFINQVNKKWRESNKSYWNNKYYNDPEYRAAVKRRALEHSRKKKPMAAELE